MVKACGSKGASEQDCRELVAVYGFSVSNPFQGKSKLVTPNPVRNMLHVSAQDWDVSTGSPSAFPNSQISLFRQDCAKQGSQTHRKQTSAAGAEIC